MTKEITNRQTAVEASGAVPAGQRAITGEPSRDDGTERSMPRFNRFIYENLLFHIEGQIETWNRKAVREANPEAAHALWLKAEGLGYALRLLYAFKPEFEELVASAEQTKCKSCVTGPESSPYQITADSHRCNSCYAIALDGTNLTAERSVR